MATAASTAEPPSAAPSARPPRRWDWRPRPWRVGRLRDRRSAPVDGRGRRRRRRGAWGDPGSSGGDPRRALRCGETLDMRQRWQCLLCLQAMRPPARPQSDHRRRPASRSARRRTHGAHGRDGDPAGRAGRGCGATSAAAAPARVRPTPLPPRPWSMRWTPSSWPVDRSTAWRPPTLWPPGSARAGVASIWRPAHRLRRSCRPRSSMTWPTGATRRWGQSPPYRDSGLGGGEGRRSGLRPGYSRGGMRGHGRAG